MIREVNDSQPSQLISKRKNIVLTLFKSEYSNNKQNQVSKRYLRKLIFSNIGIHKMKKFATEQIKTNK